MQTKFLKIAHFFNQREWVLFVPLALITHCSFLLSTNMLLDDTAALINDSWLIHNLAESYTKTGVMTMNGEPTLYQFPLYPFIISCFYKVFGVDPRAVLWTQILLSVVFINSMVIWMRGYLGGWRFLLGALLSFDLHQVLYSSCLLTEIWLMISWMIGIWCYTQYKANQKYKWWVVTMVVFTFSANIKPLSLFVPLFMSIGLGLFDSRKITRNIMLCMTGIVIFVLGMLPLLWRNYLISNQFPLLTTNSACAAWYYNIPYARAQIEGKDLVSLRLEHVEMLRQKVIESGRDVPPVPREQALDRHGHRTSLGLNEFEYAVMANQLISDYLKKNFFTYTYIHLKNGLRVFYVSNLSWLKLVYNEFDAVSFGDLNRKTLAKWWDDSDPKFWLLISRLYELLFSFGLLFFSILGSLILLIKKKFTSLHWVCWLVVFYVIGITGVNVWGRFRFLFMPILIFLGVQGIKLLIDMIKSKNVQQLETN